MSMPTCPSCIYAQGICKKTGVKIRYSTGCTYHNPKPMTNADSIRAMTDVELAEYLRNVENCDGHARDWLYWLKQEVEDAKLD